jgi:hypothetical protein
VSITCTSIEELEVPLLLQQSQFRVMCSNLQDVKWQQKQRKRVVVRQACEEAREGRVLTGMQHRGWIPTFLQVAMHLPW